MNPYTVLPGLSLQHCSIAQSSGYRYSRGMCTDHSHPFCSYGVMLCVQGTATNSYWQTSGFFNISCYFKSGSSKQPCACCHSVMMPAYLWHPFLEMGLPDQSKKVYLIFPDIVKHPWACWQLAAPPTLDKQACFPTAFSTGHIVCLRDVCLSVSEIWYFHVVCLLSCLHIMYIQKVYLSETRRWWIFTKWAHPGD